MNSAERYQRAVELFHQVCDLPESERTAFLDQACGDDADLRSAVLQLVEHDSNACDAVAAGEGGEGIRAISIMVADGEDDAPRRIGPYEIVREIGRGGMGVVYEARQEHPRRTVAVKVLNQNIGTADAIRRFQREADLLGRLQHPGIAQVFAAGVGEIEAASGRQWRQAFFAMELVDGCSLDQYASDQELSEIERLKLFARVCDAVQHAHERGVVHRDLKPSNILVMPSGLPKVLDFGVSRATDADVHTVSLQTDTGQLIGTIPYMSPEQVLGDPSAIDAQSDVYSLGVVLFQLLAGELPYALQNRPIPESVRIIREEEPTRLSSYNRQFRGDVETIVAKALEKEKSRRYGSAAELGADIRRFLKDEPIIARPASATYTFRKFARRNKGLVGGLVATFLVLLLGAAGTTVGLVSALRANEDLGKANEELGETNRRLEQTIADLNNVSEYQSSQFTDLDVSLMGVRLRTDLLEALPDDERGAFESQIVNINFVDVARTSLDQNFFGRAIDTVNERFAEQPVLQARLLQDLASAMRKLGLLQAAVDPQTLALAIRRRELGNEHPDTLLSLNEAGLLAGERSEIDKAEALYQEALDASRRVWGMDDERTLSCLHNLGSIRLTQGRLDEAEDLARQSLSGLEGRSDIDEGEVLYAMSLLASVLRAKADYEASERVYREGYALCRRVFGEDHPRTLAWTELLSVILESRGAFEESAKLAQEAYEKRRRLLGEDHPDTLSSLAEYVARLTRRGKYGEAEPKARELLDKRRRLLGRDHESTLNSIDMLASLLVDQAKFAESESLFREALERRQRIFGELHAATLRARGNVGYVLSQQGKNEDAYPYYRDTLAGLREVYGNDHPTTLTSVGNMGSLLTSLGRLEEAEPFYHESLEGRRKALGDDHPSTLNATYSMGDLLIRQGKTDEAAPFCKRALEGYQNLGGDDHIGTLYSLELVARLHMYQQEPVEAEKFYRTGVERRRRVNGDDHPRTLLVAEGLADVLEAQDRWSDAEEWRRFLLEAALRAEPRFESDIAIRQASLGNNLIHQQEFAEAESVLVDCRAIYEKHKDDVTWFRWDAQSLLGEAIAANPDRYAEAEIHLLEAAEALSGLTEPDDQLQQAAARARSRVARLYDQWGRPADAEKWRDHQSSRDIQ